MSFATSIHVRAVATADVVAGLHALGEDDCYVGRSGDPWVGVYSNAGEASGGADTPELARLLAEHLRTYAIGFVFAENATFSFWLYAVGRLVDHQPRGLLKRWLSPHRLVTDLCAEPSRPTIQAMLNRPTAGRATVPDDAGRLWEEDLARTRTMSPEEVAAFYAAKRRQAPPDAFSEMQMLAHALGISRVNLTYSTLAGEEEPAGLTLVTSSATTPAAPESGKS